MNDKHTESRDDVLIDVGRTGGRVTVTVRGEIHAHTGSVLRHVLDDLTLDQGNMFVDLDLSCVTFADAAAVAVLCRAQRRIADRGGSQVRVTAAAAIDRGLVMAGVAYSACLPRARPPT